MFVLHAIGQSRVVVWTRKRRIEALKCECGAPSEGESEGRRWVPPSFLPWTIDLCDVMLFGLTVGMRPEHILLVVASHILSLSSSLSLQVRWAKVKDFSFYMCLRWWNLVLRLVSA
jgi:hypothetical protein